MPKRRSGFQPRRPEGFLGGLLLGCCFFKLGYKTLVDGRHTKVDKVNQSLEGICVRRMCCHAVF